MGRTVKVAVHALLALAAAAFAGLYTAAAPALWALYAACAVAVELVFRLERAPWRFVSVTDVLRLARSAAIAGALTGVTAILLGSEPGPALAFVILAALMHLVALLGLRLGRRALYDGSVRALLGLGALASRGPPLLIVGPVDEAEAFLRSPASARYFCVGVVSLERSAVGEVFHDVCVLGDTGDLDPVLDQLAAAGLTPQAMLFLTPPTQTAIPAERLGRLKADGVRLLRSAPLVEIGGAAAPTDIPLEDLLFRAPAPLDLAATRALLAGKRVLVTGAAGSIGSEICRQAAAAGCARLVLLDHAESPLFTIERELADSYPQLPIVDALVNIRDRMRLEAVFAAERPQIVFHAAALKHVPLSERHPSEAVLTNLGGFRRVQEAAARHGADQLCLISTDKAVDPAGVMGATKRLAEEALRATPPGQLRLHVVRFGNVLGSAGSVAPIFQRQIAEGRPLTITDPAMERYFMTIPEAVHLVLRAAELGAHRNAPEPEVLALEMGEPVKIVDLAHRLIALHGLRPEVDVPIVFSGLRPGEKLVERLIDEGEAAEPRAPGVIAVRALRPPVLAAADFDALEALAAAGDEPAVRERLAELVGKARGGL